VSKDFDSTLSDALDLAGNAARSAGPAAARIRGGKRTMHQRIAVSTASIVVAVVGATTGFALASSHGSGPAQPAATSSHTAASSSPTSSPTHTAGSSPTASGPASSSPAESSSPASSSASVADPQQVVASAWLAPSELPFDSTFHWAAAPSVGQQLTSTVYYVANDTQYQSLTMCADPTQLLSRTVGAQSTTYTATAGSGNNQASQFIFFFADASSAQQTYTWLQERYSSSCLLNGSGAQVSKTGGDGVTSAVWLTLKGSSTAPDLPDYTREFFVLRGSTIAFDSVTSYTQSLPTAYDDAGQLSAIASHLCVYGGSCS
jgi:hypothetical protein